MDRVYVKEAGSEVLVILDKHMSDRLSALKEAARILQVEVVRELNNPRRNADWESGRHQL